MSESPIFSNMIIPRPTYLNQLVVGFRNFNGECLEIRGEWRNFAAKYRAWCPGGEIWLLATTEKNAKTA